MSVMSGIWFVNTRHKDFMAEPTASELGQIEQRVERQLARYERVELPVVKEPVPEVEKAAPVTQPEPPVPPTVSLGDFSVAPTLQLYAERSPEGAGAMIELAQALEEKNEFKRALLAWERVIDLTKASPEQMKGVRAAIKRIREVHVDLEIPVTSIPVVTVQVSVGKKLVKGLPITLSTLTRELNTAANGVVKFKSSNFQLRATSQSSDLFSVTLKGANKSSTKLFLQSPVATTLDKLQSDLQRLIFQLVAQFLAENTAYSRIAVLDVQENPGEVLSTHITRLCWSDFATSLNLAPKKSN